MSTPSLFSQPGAEFTNTAGATASTKHNILLMSLLNTMLWLLSHTIKAGITAIKVSSISARKAQLPLFCCLLLGSNTSFAHEITPAVVNISVQEDNTINVRLMVNLESMIAEIGPCHEDTEESANSQKYEALRELNPQQLAAKFELFKPVFLKSVSVTDSSTRPLTLKSVTTFIPEVGETAVRRDTMINMVYQANSTQDAFQWQWSEQFGEVIVRAESHTGELDYASLLGAGKFSAAIPIAGKDVQQSVLDVIMNYTKEGFRHILPLGLDHMLFIIAIFLISPYWKTLFLQATVFTVAHSITLALGATQVLNMPGSIVEPLIALSIVVMCIENIFSSTSGRFRLVTVFVFGLLHGLGFAAVLGEVGLDTKNFVVALLSFNVGVEVAQLLVIFICMLTVGLWLRHKPWYHSRVTVPASIVIGAIGAYWLVERII